LRPVKAVAGVSAQTVREYLLKVLALEMKSQAAIADTVLVTALEILSSIPQQKRSGRHQHATSLRTILKRAGQHQGHRHLVV
jgi:hypothetical protein